MAINVFSASRYSNTTEGTLRMKHVERHSYDGSCHGDQVLLR